MKWGTDSGVYRVYSLEALFWPLGGAPVAFYGLIAFSFPI